MGQIFRKVAEITPIKIHSAAHTGSTKTTHITASSPKKAPSAVATAQGGSSGDGKNGRLGSSVALPATGGSQSSSSPLAAPAVKAARRTRVPQATVKNGLPAAESKTDSVMGVLFAVIVVPIGGVGMALGYMLYRQRHARMAHVVPL